MCLRVSQGTDILGVNPLTIFEVDGVPRHVSHVRAKDPGQSSSDSSTDFNEEVKEEPVPRYPVRNRRRPQYLIEESRGMLFK